MQIAVVAVHFAHRALAVGRVGDALHRLFALAPFAEQDVDHKACAPEQQRRRQQPTFNLTNGPGKLTRAMGIGMNFNTRFINTGILSIDLTSQRCRQPAHIAASGRIGVPNKGKWTHEPLRYYVKDNPFVSKIPKRQINWQTYGWR